jgi:hypothetical protein
MKKTKYIFTLLLLLGVSVGFSQSTTFSPYSKYGIGVIRSESFSQNFSMGGVGIGLKPNLNINLSNPASYSGILATTFEVGFTNNALTIDDGNQQQNRNNPYIDHLAFAFPVIKTKWGMSFGLLPISSIGYGYEYTEIDPIAGSISILSNGEGGLNKFYFGNGFNINLDSTSSLSLGANGNYIFGSSERDEKVVYGEVANALNFWSLKTSSVADVNVDFGLQYQKKFTKFNVEKNDKDVYILTLGGTIALASDLNTKRSEIVRSFVGTTESGSIKDTALIIEDEKTITQLPLEYGFGISFAKDKKWLFAVDFKMADWSSLTSTSSVFSYNSNYSIASGFELTPKYNDRKYLKRISYRFGTRYSTSYITVNNEVLNEYGIAFGVKLPLRRSGTSIPGVNLGIEYGSRGKTGNGSIKETFYNFNVGITINDRWFQKRKYD